MHPPHADMAAAGVELFVPGRICLFGEHSDWAGGYRTVNPTIEKGRAILTGTDQGIRARAWTHPDSLVLRMPGGDGTRPLAAPRTYTVAMRPEALLAEAQGGGFASYVAGVACQVLLRHAVGGLVIETLEMDLPIRKGLSSSAAACVLAARAFSRLYGLGLNVREEMELAYLGERTTASRCGRLDQGCAYGRRTVLMVFDGDGLEVEEIPVLRDLHLVLVDLGAAKDTRRILRALNACYPVARDDRDRAVQAYLGPVNTAIVRRARAAMESGDAEALGRLMTEAQAVFDAQVTPACPDELAAPVLHRVLDYGPMRPHVLGGKGVGSQGDGAAQFVVRDEAGQRAVLEIVGRELGLWGAGVTVWGGGAGP